MENTEKVDGKMTDQAKTLAEDVVCKLNEFDLHQQNQIIFMVLSEIIKQRKAHLEHTGKEREEYGMLIDTLIKELSGIS